jgi:dihydrofolate synthase / folylpolyglutamate synthase
MIVGVIKGKIFNESESLFDYICAHVSSLPNQSILAIASKIVALSQGRVVDPSEISFSELIAQESEVSIETPFCALTKKDGHWCPNSGIDESNGNGKYILWPENPFAVADDLRKKLMKHFCIQDFGIVITDSRVYPLRSGVTGVSLGHAGFEALRDYRGESDLFGREMKMEQLNIADCLASASVLVMGEGSEQTPLAMIEDAPVRFVGSVNPGDLFIDPKDDMFPDFSN